MSHDEAARPATEGALHLGPGALRQLEACVHCGFCLPVCPTYRELGEEADSPRGRIDMIAGAHSGKVRLQDPELALHLDRCLDCRACESACPSGVRYHELFEEAVARLPARRPWLSNPDQAGEAAAFAGGWRLVRFGLRRLVSKPRTLWWTMRLVPRVAGLDRHLPVGLRDLLRALPAPVARPARARLPKVLPAQGRRRGAVDLFLGCIQDAAFGDENMAIARVLSRCGYDVRAVRTQGCCGALHQHTGRRLDLEALAAVNLTAFTDDDERPIIVGAGGCSAVLKDYGRLLADGPLAEPAARLSARVRDFSEFLAGLPDLPEALPPPGAPLRVTYHDPCHLAHAQGIRREPRTLLAAVPGVEFVELQEADSCCGSAGIYNLVEPDLAARVLERKIANIETSAADVVVTCNAGCALQLRVGLARRGLPVRVLSLGGFLAEVWGCGVA